MKTMDRLRSHPRVEIADVEPDGCIYIQLRQGYSFDSFADNRVRLEDNATAALRTLGASIPFDGPYTD